MPKVACFIDGFNLYHAIDAIGDERLKWLNLRALAEKYLRPGEELAHAVYFSAFMRWSPQKLKRHLEYVAALAAVGVEPVMSEFQRVRKACPTSGNHCKFFEEKRTDVAMATRMLADAMSGGLARLMLITADSDQVPTLGAIRALVPSTEVCVLAPPGRAAIARELKQVAHDFREVSTGALERSLLPRNVTNAEGKIAARAPSKYQ